MRLEGAGSGVRFATYPAQIGSAVVVAAADAAGGDACRRRAAGTHADRVFAARELQPMMRLGMRMGVNDAAVATTTPAGDQAIGARGWIHPRLRCLHRIVLRGGTQQRFHPPCRRIALLVPSRHARTHTKMYRMYIQKRGGRIKLLRSGRVTRGGKMADEDRKRTLTETARIEVSMDDFLAHFFYISSIRNWI